MSDKSSAPLPPEREKIPGLDWLEIIKRPTQEAFATAFSDHVVLDAWVTPRPIVGAADIRTFFDAARTMYEAIAFKRETNTGSQTYLEWEGVFEGDEVAGMTILTIDSAGLIEAFACIIDPLAGSLLFRLSSRGGWLGR